jgi:RNA ligase
VLRIWCSILLFANLNVGMAHYNSLPKDDPGFRATPQEVTFQGKVKLHGCNTGVTRVATGLAYQSRETVLTPTSDLKGFAKWASAHPELFTRLPEGATLFGEWAGPGVEGGMAVSNLPQKIWAVFGAILADGTLVYDPEQLRELAPDCLILPWATEEVVVDFTSPTSLGEVEARVNEMVAQIEQEDPWIRATFGVSGLGEGLVFYPVGELPPGWPAQDLLWKAKGDKHRTAGIKPVQVKPTASPSVEAFVQNVVTPARLEQGLSFIGGVKDPKKTGAFLQWLVADVQKETGPELAASNLTWDQVKNAVQVAARTWFLQK